MPPLPPSLKRPPLWLLTTTFVLSAVLTLPIFICIALWYFSDTPAIWILITFPLFLAGQGFRLWWEWMYAGDVSSPFPPHLSE